MGHFCADSIFVIDASCTVADSVSPSLFLRLNDNQKILGELWVEPREFLGESRARGSTRRILGERRAIKQRIIVTLERGGSKTRILEQKGVTTRILRERRVNFIFFYIVNPHFFLATTRRPGPQGHAITHKPPPKHS